MSVGPPSAVSRLELPETGAIRVHPEPAALPRLRREGAGRNRFDDPDGIFLVRYAADTLHGCLVETMARFRPHPATDAVLSTIGGVGDGDIGESTYADPARAVVAWLADQQVGQLHVTSPAPLLVDVEVVAMLDRLDAHPRGSRRAGRLPPRFRGRPGATRRGAIIRLGGALGRPVTQAVSRAVCSRYRGFVDPVWNEDQSRRAMIGDHGPDLRKHS
jgi:hypothetical protein